MQQMIDLYVKAVDLAKQGEGLSNLDKMILNKFKILLLSGAAGNADISDDERERILENGKKRANMTEKLITSELKRNGLIIDTIKYFLFRDEK